MSCRGDTEENDIVKTDVSLLIVRKALVDKNVVFFLFCLLEHLYEIYILVFILSPSLKVVVTLPLRRPCTSLLVNYVF